MKKVVIRPAKLADAAEIANVHINSWKESYQGLLPQDYLNERHLLFKNRYELWKRVTADENQVTFVAESEEHGVVGFINGNKARDEKYQDHTEVYCIYLLKKYHGQKFGFELLKNYFDVRYKEGFKQAYLWVLADNPTIRFYEKAGAKFTGETQTDQIGGVEVKELCYHWDDINLC